MTVRSLQGTPAIQNGIGRRGFFSGPWVWLPIILGIVLAALFYQSFQPGQVLFANDLTLGQMKAPSIRLPGAFTGVWRPNWLGIEGPAEAPTASAFLTMLLSPELFLKTFAPLSLLFVGFCAWLFFRQLNFNPWVCVLGGLAAGLNMHFFSIACWGLGQWNVATGLIFLSLAALHAKSIPQLWARATLVGLAVGMNLMEGYDIGAIQSVYVGAYVMWQVFTDDSLNVKKVVATCFTEVLVVLFAGFIAVHSISTLVSTQVEGVVGTGQDTQTKDDHWDFATRWSLPKIESLRVMMPGIFGYRMSSRMTVPDRSPSYWGTVGRDVRVADLLGADQARKHKAYDSLSLTAQMRSDFESGDHQVQAQTFRTLLGRFTSAARYSGSGEYAGMLVSVLAIFGCINAWREAKAPYSFAERRAVWFWFGAAVISLLAAWGRHGFFYRVLYQLPYFSTIRNPIKFLHPFHVAWVILAAYGLEVLWRRYMQPAPASNGNGFEKKWIIGSAVVVGLAVAAAGVYTAQKTHLISYLIDQGFDAHRAIGMADFSNSEAWWSVGWLVVSLGTLALILNRAWTGAQARTAGIILGVIIIVDLAKSDIPWIHYFDYVKEYGANSILDFLQDKPYEHRVCGRASPKGPGSSINTRLGQLYDYWQQNDFPYRGIQCLDFPQWPRTPELDAAFIKNFSLKAGTLAKTDLWPAARLWELTSTRYIFYSTELLAVLNSQADAQHGLSVKTLLSLHPKANVTYLEDAGDMTAEPDSKGDLALLEFTNALPRAKLFANWVPQTNDDDTLKTLLSHDFDAQHTVLLASNTPVAQSPGDPKADPGTVTIAKFVPKYIQLQASVAKPAILMLTDRVGANWHAYIDRKPAPILRCNYIMRGLYLTPGEHLVEFRYRPKLTTFWISLCGWGVGVLTAGYLVWSHKFARKSVVTADAAPPPPSPAPSPSPARGEAAAVKQKPKEQPVAPVRATTPSRPPPGGKRTKRR